MLFKYVAQPTQSIESCSYVIFNLENFFFYYFLDNIKIRWQLTRWQWCYFSLLPFFLKIIFSFCYGVQLLISNNFLSIIIKWRKSLLIGIICRYIIYITDFYKLIPFQRMLLNKILFDLCRKKKVCYDIYSRT